MPREWHSAAEEALRGHAGFDGPADAALRVRIGRAGRIRTPRLTDLPAGWRATGWGFRATFPEGAATVSGDPTALSSLLRTIATPLLLPDGVLLHACGVDGWVFAGASQSGKTTMARRFPPARVLNDDAVVLERDAHGWWVSSTPFLGQARAAAFRRVPLDALVLLARGARVAVRDVPAAEAVARLAACVYLAPGSARFARAALEWARCAVQELEPAELAVPLEAAAGDVEAALAEHRLDRWVRRVAAGGAVLVARGTSMAPMVCDGDPLWVEPARLEDLRAGDIAVVRTGPARLVAHRVVRAGRRAVTLRGDGMLRVEHYRLGKGVALVGRARPMGRRPPSRLVAAAQAVLTLPLAATRPLR